MPCMGPAYIGWVREGWNGRRWDWRLCIDHKVAHDARRRRQQKEPSLCEHVCSIGCAE